VDVINIKKAQQDIPVGLVKKIPVF